MADYLGLTLTTLEELQLHEWLKSDLSLKKAWEVNLTKSFNEQISKKSKIGIQNHVVIFIYGTQGLGKSKIVSEIMKQIDPNVDASNICFSSTEVLDKLSYFKSGGVVARDETYAEFGVGSSRIKANLSKSIETLRKANISFVIARPTFERINGVHWILRVLARNDEQRKTLCSLEDPYTGRTLGGVVFDIPEDDDLFWIEYSKNKDAFIESTKNQDSTGYNVEDKANKALSKLLEEDSDLTNYSKPKERKIFIKKFYSGFTVKEQDDISTEMERLIRINDGELIDN